MSNKLHFGSAGERSECHKHLFHFVLHCGSIVASTWASMLTGFSIISGDPTIDWRLNAFFEPLSSLIFGRSTCAHSFDPYPKHILYSVHTGIFNIAGIYTTTLTLTLTHQQLKRVD